MQSMALTVAGFVNQAAIDSAVRKVEDLFAPQVVRIQYTLENNHYGDPSITFRVLVTDDAAHDIDQLYELSEKISHTLINEAQTHEIGLQAYFSYRTVSEQEKLPDPMWK
jgi:hypothetical protein